MIVETGEIRAGGAPAPDGTALHVPDPRPEAVPGGGTGELAARLRILRRARRDAETRAARVRRVLLAPTPPAPAGTRVRAPKPHRR